MRESEVDRLAITDETDDGEPERRGFTWAVLVVLLVVTLLVAIVMAYLITVHNFPAH